MMKVIKKASLTVGTRCTPETKKVLRVIYTAQVHSQIEEITIIFYNYKAYKSLQQFGIQLPQQIPYIFYDQNAKKLVQLKTLKKIIINHSTYKCKSVT